MPANVVTRVKSATQQWFGADATKSRSTRSGAGSALASGMVVITLFAADRSGDAEFTHEALDGATGHRDILAVQVPPDLPGAVDTVVGLVRLCDQSLQFGVADGAGRGCGPAFVVGVIGGRGDLAVVVGEDRQIGSTPPKRSLCSSMNATTCVWPVELGREEGRS